jgi:hypothetical protein
MFWRSTQIALFAFAIGTPASAQMQVVGPGDYHCSAAPGEYANQAIPPLEAGKPIVVRFRLIADHPDRKWPAQAAIQFVLPDNRVSVLVEKSYDDPDHMYLSLVDHKTNYGELIARYHVTNLFIEVGLDVNERGMLRVKTGPVDKLNLKTRPPVKTELHCHSGEFEIQVVRPQG